VLLEYGLAGATVAVGFGHYLATLCGFDGDRFDVVPPGADGWTLSPVGAGLVVLISAALMVRVRESFWINNGITTLTVTAILITIIAGGCGWGWGRGVGRRLGCRAGAAGARSCTQAPERRADVLLATVTRSHQTPPPHPAPPTPPPPPHPHPPPTLQAPPASTAPTTPPSSTPSAASRAPYRRRRPSCLHSLVGGAAGR
jgi:hypothetical protein